MHTEVGDCRPMALFFALLMLIPFDLIEAATLPATPEERMTPEAATAKPRKRQPREAVSDEIPAPEAVSDSTVYLDAELLVRKPGERDEDGAITTVVEEPGSPYGLDGKKIFNPQPERAVWLSALCPGLGQIYNRRYWKLPIIVGGFMGLGYATSWNNTQYQDYTQGYRDLLDADPNTKSYMNFFPPTTTEDQLDKTWLENILRSRKDYYRRNRDLCIICVVGLYLLCMLDAYVDASMAHFDISPSLSMDVAPSLILDRSGSRPAAGMTWALTF